MKRAIAILALLTGLLVWFKKNEPVSSSAPTTPPPLVGPEDTGIPADPPLLADRMLQDYGTDNSSSKNDLELVGRLIDSAFLLVKNRDTREYATNEDLVLFLQGRNSYQSAYLGKTSPVLNGDGQMIDRWGSPLIVHPVSQKILELRSAGPDRKPYTDDDLIWPEATKQ